MPHYEYKVVPAPTKGLKARGVKTPEARFANSVELVLNTLGTEGWEYLRAELLPSDERSGLTGSTTNWRNVLVFRRPVTTDADAFQPRLLEVSGPEPIKAAEPEAVAEPDVVAEREAAPEPAMEPDPESKPEPVENPETQPKLKPETDEKTDPVWRFTNVAARAAKESKIAKRQSKGNAPRPGDPEKDAD